jgi:hypothetical protein
MILNIHRRGRDRQGLQAADVIAWAAAPKRPSHLLGELIIATAQHEVPRPRASRPEPLRLLRPATPFRGRVAHDGFVA